MVGMDTFRCDYCDRTFQRYKSQIRGKRKFCSYKCRARFYREKMRSVNTKNINLEATSNLAYFLGAWLGDGDYWVNEENRSYCVRVSPGLSRRFAERCRECLESFGLNPTMWFWVRKNRRRGQWKVHAYSVKLVEYLKSLSLDKVKEILSSRKLKLWFARGFFDAEGTVDVRGAPGTVRASMCNTNKEIIDFVHELLEGIGFHPSVYGPFTSSTGGKDVYHIFVGRAEECLILFEGSVKGKKAKERLSRQNYKLKPWSEKELEILKRYYGTASNEKISKMLPDRSLRGISDKARSLGF